MTKQLVLGGRASHESDVPIWHKKIKIRTHESAHNLLKVIFYTDKRIEMSKISRGLKKCKEIG